jgi:uncharacterized protein YbgA (DUF1722 family)/uncharacterized protein YbbK (DUF523 family)
VIVPEAPIRIGISQCLLGEPVRYDGGHKRDRFLTDLFGPHVEYHPVCPEVEMGMGIPREAVRLEGDPESPRMVGVRSGEEHGAAMRRFSRQRVRELGDLDLCGYVLKKGSPSCGMERVKLYPEGGGAPSTKGVGLFARELMKRYPLLPVEEEGRLHDPVLRENFIERVFAYRRWKDFLAERYSVGRLVTFHTAHKFLILSHSPGHYTELGRLVARAKALGAGEARAAYGQRFMEAVARRTTVRKHTNVLQHMTGFLKKDLDEDSRRELGDIVEDYRVGIIPLIVPVTLIRHHARRVKQPYLLNQVYLEPHPKELMLRNHV